MARCDRIIDIIGQVVQQKCKVERRMFCRLTPDMDASSGVFSLSTLHLILTNCPTLRQSVENGRNPTARHGSRTGRFSLSAILNRSSSESPGWTGAGECAPVVLSPDIPYLIFSMLSTFSTSSISKIHKVQKSVSVHRKLFLRDFIFPANLK
jgi:hypothetical protein